METPALYNHTQKSVVTKQPAYVCHDSAVALEKANCETYNYADIARIQFVGYLPMVCVRTADQQADA